mmetsp:Transcript_5714/g.11450  ORF Transcript_5714/g.11450 Transcript_5714/m.11450 type:complete len:354 (+) Transcript_5714:2-1063(+)
MEKLTEANQDLHSARSILSASDSVEASVCSALNVYLVFQIFYNIALPFNTPLGESPPEFGASFGGIETLADQVKAYKFEKNFYMAKGCDNIDYFLCGTWVSVAILHYERVDLLKKYRGKVIPSMQKLGLASHFDYEQVWLECMLICFGPLQTSLCVGEGALAGQVLRSMGFSWDCEEFSATFDIIARGSSVSFLDNFSRNSFVLMINLMLLLCDLSPEEVRRSQTWLPSHKEVLEMNSEHIFSKGLSVLDIPSLCCLVYEKLGRYDNAEMLANAALKSVKKPIPLVCLHYVLGRCYGRSGIDDREGREYYTNGIALARRSGLNCLVRIGQKEEDKWYGGSSFTESKREGETLW